MKIHHSRHYMEVRVGLSSLVEVVLHVRDRAWWNEDDKGRTSEFLELLQQDVLPRLLREEIQDDATRDGYQKAPKLGMGGVPLVAGETNDKKKVAGKRKRSTKKNKKEEVVEEMENPDKHKDFYHSFGDDMQLTFCVEPMGPHAGATLAVGPQKDAFQHLRRLDKRIVAWCFAYDGNKEPDPLDDGPYRPDFVPLSWLFRQPENVDGAPTI